MKKYQIAFFVLDTSASLYNLPAKVNSPLGSGWGSSDFAYLIQFSKFSIFTFANYEIDDLQHPGSLLHLHSQVDSSNS